MQTEVNYTTEYIAINLKHWKLVTRAALPSLRTVRVHERSGVFEVKGAAIEASASERLIPISAVFKATQSFAPSPTIPTIVYVVGSYSY